MGEKWGQPPSRWLPHLTPLQAYHLDQALCIQLVHLDAQTADTAETPLTGPRGGPVNQMRLPNADQQRKMDALKARAAAGQTRIRRGVL